jgi:hypothetical protein
MFKGEVENKGRVPRLHKEKIKSGWRPKPRRPKVAQAKKGTR